MKIYWFVFFFVSVAWASEKEPRKITHYFMYDKVAKKNITVFKYEAGEYYLEKPKINENLLPKPPLRRQMVINDIHAYMERVKKCNELNKEKK